MRKLTKVHSTKKKISEIPDNFFVFDTETTKLEPRPENFVFGVLYGKNFVKVFHSVKGFKKELQKEKYRNKYIFAHNAEFDLMVLFEDLYREIDASIIFNNRFISAVYKESGCIFADSMNIYPASVEKIGKLMGLEKLSNEKVKQEGLRKNNITKQDIEYCVRDCEIIYNALLEMFQHIGTIRITMASLSMYNYRNEFLEKDLIYSPLVDEFFESYYGGRTECFRIGEVNAKVYDINSMYPFAMENVIFPDVTNLKKESKVDVRYLKYLLKYHEGLAKVTVKHKQTFFGYLPVRIVFGSGSKLCFPVGVFTTTVNFNELKFAVDSGVVEVLNVEYVVYGNPQPSPFKKFIEENYSKRNETTNELHRTIYKNKMNTLYGKFAQRMKYTQTYYDELPLEIIKELDKTQKFYEIKLFNKDRSDLFLITENEKFKNSFFAVPAYSSYITSWCRVLLLKNLLANESNSPVYCDTDSIFLEGQFVGSVSSALGNFKLEGKRITKISGLKNYSCIDEEGISKDVIKGVSKNAKVVIDSRGNKVYEIKKYYKTKESLHRNKSPGQGYILRKEMKSKYDKRIVMPNGSTKPLNLKSFKNEVGNKN